MKATINRMGRKTFPAVLAGVMAFTVLATNSYANSAVYQQTLKSTAWVVAKVEGGLSRGSGVLVDKERRLVVTNYHVVLGAREAMIFFPYMKDGSVVAERDFYVRNAKKLGIKSRVIAVDRKRDLALIELPALSADVPAIEFADNSASPGETVHSVGNPGSSDVLWAYTSGTVRGCIRRSSAQASANTISKFSKRSRRSTPATAADRFSIGTAWSSA